MAWSTGLLGLDGTVPGKGLAGAYHVGNKYQLLLAFLCCYLRGFVVMLDLAHGSSRSLEAEDCPELISVPQRCLSAQLR